MCFIKNKSNCPAVSIPFALFRPPYSIRSIPFALFYSLYFDHRLSVLASHDSRH